MKEMSKNDKKPLYEFIEAFIDFLIIVFTVVKLAITHTDMFYYNVYVITKYVITFFQIIILLIYSLYNDIDLPN